MPKVKSTKTTGASKPNIRPALTPENAEQQCISLAVDLVRQRLIDGTASSQETTHFLKQASSKNRLELEILELQKELVKAKTESLQSQKRSEDMFREAMKAFRGYSGQEEEVCDEDY